MVFYARKNKTILAVIAVLFSCVDVFLMSYYGFNGQALILLYVTIGTVALGGLLFYLSNMVPSVKLNDHCKTIVTNAVYDERSCGGKKLMISFSTIHLEEVRQCEVVGNSIVLSMKWGLEKTLYLSAFSKRQINSIEEEISKRIE